MQLLALKRGDLIIADVSAECRATVCQRSLREQSSSVLPHEPLTQAEQSRSAKRSKPLKRYAPCSCQPFVAFDTDVYGLMGSDLYASIGSRRNDPQQYEPTPGLPILDIYLEALLSRTS